MILSAIMSIIAIKISLTSFLVILKNSNYHRYAAAPPPRRKVLIMLPICLNYYPIV